MAKGELVAMLTAKKVVGLAPEVNLKNLSHAGNEPYKWGIHPDFETKEYTSGPLKRLISHKNVIYS